MYVENQLNDRAVTFGPPPSAVRSRSLVASPRGFVPSGVYGLRETFLDDVKKFVNDAGQVVDAGGNIIGTASDIEHMFDDDPGTGATVSNYSADPSSAIPDYHVEVGSQKKESEIPWVPIGIGAVVVLAFAYMMMSK
jgi:hypothetical protein